VEICCYEAAVARSSGSKAISLSQVSIFHSAIKVKFQQFSHLSPLLRFQGHRAVSAGGKRGYHSVNQANSLYLRYFASVGYAVRT